MKVAESGLARPPLAKVVGIHSAEEEEEDDDDDDLMGHSGREIDRESLPVPASKWSSFPLRVAVGLLLSGVGFWTLKASTAAYRRSALSSGAKVTSHQLPVLELQSQFPEQRYCSDEAAPKLEDLVPKKKDGDVLAFEESEGFFEESSHTWTLRKLRHLQQMCLQREIMISCTNASVEYGRECFLGCEASPSWTNCGVPRLGVPRASLPCIQNCQGFKFYQAHYEPSFSCDFERRVGAQGEGGKWVCDPHKLQAAVAAGKSCLVYSVGSHGQYDFESSVHSQISSQCEIHTIDSSHWKRYNKGPPPAYVNYHIYTVGARKPQTDISTIVKKLGHEGRQIDIFKIDCEQCEWQTYASWFGSGVQIRQILVELHGVHPQTHSFFKHLFDLGYVVFHKEPNTVGCRGDCIEYAFLKLSPKFSRFGSVANGN